MSTAAEHEGHCSVCGGKIGELHEEWCECKPNCKIGEEKKMEDNYVDTAPATNPNITRADAPPVVMREFDTGATRSQDTAKPDYEGFLSPAALVRYGEYMNEHRVQADGKVRESDNWQKGIPIKDYMKSLARHFMDIWMLHRHRVVYDRDDGHVITRQEALCGILFNTFGYLHEVEKCNAPKE